MTHTLLSKKNLTGFLYGRVISFLFFFSIIVCTSKWSSAQLPTLQLVPFSSGYSGALDIENCGDSRLFIVEQSGKIWICDSAGNKRAKPFLDITNKVYSVGSEQGLLGLAFDPDYKNNGYFYVNYINQNQDTRIARFQVSNTNPNKADKQSELKILGVHQPSPNHNGGCLRFGPDNYLYIGLGDGGPEGDFQNNAQNPKELLGKMLRIDVHSGNPYSIPPSNPFVGVSGYKDEIWALGMRNPWRFSFDQLTNDLWIGDVGQNAWEEVDLQLSPSNGGENYGWRCYEGNHPYNLTGCGSMSNYVFPVYDYPHQDNGDCSVIGGYVYRGTNFQNMFGKYFYNDYCSGNFKVLFKNGSTWENSVLLNLADYSYVAWGVNYRGELFVTNTFDGTIYHVVDASQLAGKTALLTADHFLQLYPNPNNGMFTLDWNSNQNEKCTLIITNVLGQTVFSQKLNAHQGWNRWQIEPGTLSSGNFILQMNSSRGLTSQKLIVE
ncbi:MAG: PQQ-dependent sugar dehydrogenase [Chitinophagales bacterium]|nr:PQQ-dependent sugar dehydrogenase [Chitinophagales bacterium]